MTFLELKNKLKDYPLFRTTDIFKYFPETKKQNLLNQLNLWIKKGYLESIRKGIYKFNDFQISDSFILANFIYRPSYISLESALNYYGIIPDIPFAITSISRNKTKIFKNKNYGNFYYYHLKPSLFFGFKTIPMEKNYSYNIASPEKSLFDYLYLKAKKIDSINGFLKELRLSLPDDFNWQNLKKWSQLISVKNKTFHNLITTLLKKYAQ